MNGEQIRVFGLLLMFCFSGWVLIGTRVFSLLTTTTKKSSSHILRICALLHIYFHLKLLERNMEIYRKI